MYQEVRDNRVFCPFPGLTRSNYYVGRRPSPFGLALRSFQPPPGLLNDNQEAGPLYENKSLPNINNNPGILETAKRKAYIGMPVSGSRMKPRRGHSPVLAPRSLAPACNFPLRDRRDLSHLAPAQFLAPAHRTLVSAWRFSRLHYEGQHAGKGHQ